MTASPEWLSSPEQDTWRAFLQAGNLLTAQLETTLKTAHNLPLSDFEILLILSEAPDHRLPMNELATQTVLQKSRLTYRVTALENAGHVIRQSCPDDKRVIWTVLTEQGFAFLTAAAQTQLALARTHFTPSLQENDPTQLTRFCQRLIASLKTPPSASVCETPGH